jgi:hypothetical protein
VNAEMEHWAPRRTACPVRPEDGSTGSEYLVDLAKDGPISKPELNMINRRACVVWDVVISQHPQMKATS